VVLPDSDTMTADSGGDGPGTLGIDESGKNASGAMSRPAVTRHVLGGRVLALAEAGSAGR